MYLSSFWLKTRNWLRLGGNSMCLLARFWVAHLQQEGCRLRLGLGPRGTKHSQGPTTEEPTCWSHCLSTVGSHLHSLGLWTLDIVSRILTHPPPSLHRQEELRTISWDENCSSTGRLTRASHLPLISSKKKGTRHKRDKCLPQKDLDKMICRAPPSSNILRRVQIKI